MTNAEKFRNTFGIYATELWLKSPGEFVDWLNFKYSEDLREEYMSDDSIIGREETYNTLCKVYPLLQKEYLRKVIDEIPSAEPQIIRCKDCVHWKPSSIRPNYCDVWDWCNQADDFCSFAERREE